MSIVLYHARIDASTLEALRADPELFWDLPQHADPGSVQQLYTDKDWEALCWLLSAKAREEQKHDVVGLALSLKRKDGESRGAWDGAKAQEAAKRGFQLVETKSMPDEPALIAIQGRGPVEGRFLEIGLHAQIFTPDEVSALSAALDRITDADLRAHFDPQMMESLDVAGILWTEEDRIRENSGPGIRAHPSPFQARGAGRTTRRGGCHVIRWATRFDAPFPSDGYSSAPRLATVFNTYRRAVRRGSVTTPAKPAGDHERTRAPTPPQGTRPGRTQDWTKTRVSYHWMRPSSVEG